MISFIKKILKGFLYLIAFPVFVIVLSIVSVIGAIGIIYMFFKSIFLFFTGRSLYEDLPEDRKAKQIISKLNLGLTLQQAINEVNNPVVEANSNSPINDIEIGSSSINLTATTPNVESPSSQNNINESDLTYPEEMATLIKDEEINKPNEGVEISNFVDEPEIEETKEVETNSNSKEQIFEKYDANPGIITDISEEDKK